MLWQRVPERVAHDGVTERQCNRCGEWWPIGDYHFANPGKRSRVCNGCRSERRALRAGRLGVRPVHVRGR
jgi:hypothetical protein